MNYYIWVNGFDGMGIVKGNTIDEAREKVIKKMGKCQSINLLDDEFDDDDVAVLII